MSRFLVELSHESDGQTCARFVKLVLTSGSHFLTNADWGCKDGEHKAWIMVEVDTRDEARNVIPPQFRAQAKIVQLNAFTPKDVEGMLQPHQP
jgi:nicotinate-nucleotide pyrophosphorylase